MKAIIIVVIEIIIAMTQVTIAPVSAMSESDNAISSFFKTATKQMKIPEQMLIKKYKTSVNLVTDSPSIIVTDINPIILKYLKILVAVSTVYE